MKYLFLTKMFIKVGKVNSLNLKRGIQKDPTFNTTFSVKDLTLSPKKQGRDVWSDFITSDQHFTGISSQADKKERKEERNEEKKSRLERKG